jgi:hypothetical protein
MHVFLKDFLHPIECVEYVIGLVIDNSHLSLVNSAICLIEPLYILYTWSRFEWKWIWMLLSTIDSVEHLNLCNLETLICKKAFYVTK